MDTSFENRPDLERPRIRAVEAFPTEQNGEQIICLRDAENIAQNVLALHPALFSVINFFDGRHTVEDIQSELYQEFGETIPLENIESIIQQLDKELFLESNTFFAAQRQLIEAYQKSPNRPAAFAGRAYAGGEEELKTQLDGFMQAMRNERGASSDNSSSGDVHALISPHIDLHRGGPCFAYAYNELMTTDPADLYIVLGTGHRVRNSLLVCTEKSYDTPLGEVKTDTAFIKKFNQNSTEDVFAEEILHKDEHSIEFQALWLRYVLGPQWQGKMVPMLCGSFYEYVNQGVSPRNDKDLAHDLDLLREMIAEYDGRVCVIAGVDMSHVGKRFGHEQGIPDSELARVESEDQEVLNSIEHGTAEDFYWSVAKENDRNNVCGLSPVYMMLDIVRPKAGRVLKYDRALEPETESVVTFASVAYRY